MSPRASGGFVKVPQVNALGTLTTNPPSAFGDIILITNFLNVMVLLIIMCCVRPIYRPSLETLDLIFHIPAVHQRFTLQQPLLYTILR